MPLSETLQSIINNALKCVENNNDHNLNLGYRRAIWNELGVIYNYNNPNDRAGVNRRTVLAMLATKKVLYLWEEVWPADKQPHLLLEETKLILERKKDLFGSDADLHMNKWWSWFENLDYDDTNDKHLRVLGVAAAALKTLSTALFDELFESDNIDYSIKDDEVDYTDSDSSYYAAAAYANGTIWDEHSDKDKRKEFWEWWLTEAVTKAWDMEY